MLTLIEKILFHLQHTKDKQPKEPKYLLRKHLLHHSSSSQIYFTVIQSICFSTSALPKSSKQYVSEWFSNCICIWDCNNCYCNNHWTQLLMANQHTCHKSIDEWFFKWCFTKIGSCLSYALLDGVDKWTGDHLCIFSFVQLGNAAGIVHQVLWSSILPLSLLYMIID